MNEPTPQKKMKKLLESANIPYIEIECYGSQITIESKSLKAATKWTQLLSTFAKVRGTIETIKNHAENKNTCLRPSSYKIWRTYAVIK